MYRLGNSASSFHAERGNLDYVRIRDFAADDRLVLFGQASDYSQSGYQIVDGHVGYGVSFRGDLIALIQGDRMGGYGGSLGLLDAQAQYV